MEPLSAFYSSPLVVLDFQSLYPSIMIAYNYCYSTCLGRVQDFKGTNKFGVLELHNPPGLLETLKEHLFGMWLRYFSRMRTQSLTFEVAPNGMIYVKPNVRRGLLGRMLTELLDTRIMVKQAMKKVKDNKVRTFYKIIFDSPWLPMIGTHPHSQRTPTQFKVYLQRHIRIHKCLLFGSYARCRDSW